MVILSSPRLRQLLGMVGPAHLYPWELSISAKVALGNLVETKYLPWGWVSCPWVIRASFPGVWPMLSKPVSLLYSQWHLACATWTSGALGASWPVTTTEDNIKPQKEATSLLFQVETSHIPVVLPSLGPVNGKQVPEKHSKSSLKVFKVPFSVPCRTLSLSMKLRDL